MGAIHRVHLLHKIKPAVGISDGILSTKFTNLYLRQRVTISGDYGEGVTQIKCKKRCLARIFAPVHRA
jgi:hypothetical protein